MYGGALPSAWGAIVKFAFPLPRVGTFVGATSSGDVRDGISESMSYSSKRCGNLRRSHLLNRLLTGLGGRPLDSLRRKMIIRHMILRSALLLSWIDSSSAIAIMSGTCQNIYGSFRSSYTNHGCCHFWIPPVVDASISGYIQDVANCGCHQLWMPPSGSPSNNAANSEVPNNSPWLSYIERS